MTTIVQTADGAELLTVSEYAARHNLGHRTVQRYISGGQLPTASKDHKGKWRIPADAMPTEPPAAHPAPAPPGAVPAVTSAAPLRTTSHDVRQTYAAPTRDREQPAVLGMLGTLEEAAQALGTTVGGVRRLASDGHLIVGRYGPHGSLRVFVPPTGR